jgi:phage tail P2-like protein
MSDLLPSSATAAERALSNAVERHATLPVPVRDVWDADTCPAALLPWLAWAYSVDEWDTRWSEQQKREVIRRSIEVHRYKGTIGAVREALAALFFDSRIQEWFNQTPNGTPYTFKVLLQANQVGIEQAAFNKLFQVIDRAKNLRSHLDSVELFVSTPSVPYIAGAAGVGSEVVVTNFVLPTTVVNETTIAF